MAGATRQQGPPSPSCPRGPPALAPGNAPPLASPHWSAETRLASKARPPGEVPPPLATGAAMLSVAGWRRVGPFALWLLLRPSQCFSLVQGHPDPKERAIGSRVFV